MPWSPGPTACPTRPHPGTPLTGATKLRPQLVQLLCGEAAGSEGLSWAEPPLLLGFLFQALGILGCVASLTVHLGIQVLLEGVGDIFSVGFQCLLAALGVKGQE